VYLTPPLNGFPLELGIGESGRKSSNDGTTRWSKKFQDRSFRHNTGCDRRTDRRTKSRAMLCVARVITLTASPTYNGVLFCLSTTAAQLLKQYARPVMRSGPDANGNSADWLDFQMSPPALSLSIRFNGHFFHVKLVLLALRVMEAVVTTGAIRRAKLQSIRRHQQTNIQLFTGRMPFLSPN